MQLSAFIGHLRLAGIYDGFEPGPEVDLQGWGSQHEIFERLIDELRPNSIIELGSWKGASAVHMARLCRARRLNCTILCIDTWLGGRYLYAELDQHPELLPTAGRLRLFEQFLTNVKRLELTDIITPMPSTTSDAAGTLRKSDVAVDLVYVDASHEAEDVAKDLRVYWDVVRPGGVLFGDDYAPAWPGVVKAVDAFAAEIGRPVEHVGIKYVIRKPLALRADGAALRSPGSRIRLR